MFAPSRGRELKYRLCKSPRRNNHVRPLAGAGIEILCVVYSVAFDFVRPLAGAGIEIRR